MADHTVKTYPSVRTYQAGETTVIWAEVRNPAGTLIDPDAGVALVRLSDPEGTIKVSNTPMTKSVVGKYYYFYTTLVTSVVGWWNFEVKSTDGTNYGVAQGGFYLQGVNYPDAITSSALSQLLALLEAGRGALGASAWVVASDASVKIKTFAQVLQDLGYPVWVCDGVADQVEMQAAIDAGGKIQLNGKTFEINAPVYFGDNITFEGEGIGLTTLRMNDNANCMFFSTKLAPEQGAPPPIHTIGDGNKNITIRNMTLDHNGSNNTNTVLLVLLNATQNLTFENIDYINVWADSKTGGYEARGGHFLYSLNLTLRNLSITTIPGHNDRSTGWYPCASKNVLIENIKGWTADDLLYIGGGLDAAGKGGENYEIWNIYGGSGGANIIRCAAYLSNVHISGIYPDLSYSLMNVISLTWGANTQISGVSIENVYAPNAKILIETYSSPGFTPGSLSYIQALSISNCWVGGQYYDVNMGSIIDLPRVLGLDMNGVFISMLVGSNPAKLTAIKLGGTGANDFAHRVSIRGCAILASRDTIRAISVEKGINVKFSEMEVWQLHATGDCVFYIKDTTGFGISDSYLFAGGSSYIFRFAGTNVDFKAANNKLDGALIVGTPPSNFKVHHNLGYITENSGVATITGAVNTVVVTHGLAATPTRVLVTACQTGQGDYAITARGATTFTITFVVQPGASTWTFDWKAQVGEG